MGKKKKNKNRTPDNQQSENKAEKTNSGDN